MRTSLGVLFFLMAARLAAAQVGPVDRWGGAPEGSWVKAHVTYQLGEKKQEQDTTRTVSEVHEDQIVLRVDNTPGNSGATFRMRRDLLSVIASTEGVVVEQKDLPAEDVAVGAASFKCVVRQLRWKLAKEAKIVDTLKLWECDEAPGRIVKAEGVFHDVGMKEGGGWKFESKLTSLSEKVTLGAKELPCATFESSASGPGPWTDKLWISKDVPGMIVRSVGHRELHGKKETTEWSVVDFAVKK